VNIHDVSRDNIADAPTVDCAQTWARVGDLDVRLQCRVRSRPSPTALYWVVDANGTTVSSGDTLNDYWTLVRVSICPLSVRHVETPAHSTLDWSSVCGASSFAPTITNKSL